ncbi:hypothetical protein CH365_19675 [Leptospira neocaledonica]|uniref:DUF3955 domain-containing protein n=1 Tax=Leptospira neocaledonica TaxID=2023192 RepID=A0A2M9ZTD4_9LEPT|nr:hypothetical protein CH365_19675 [Leptospira neocaledonica]
MKTLFINTLLFLAGACLIISLFLFINRGYIFARILEHGFAATNIMPLVTPLIVLWLGICISLLYKKMQSKQKEKKK